MDIRSDVLAMDERTYRLWADAARGATFTWTAEAAARLIPARKSVGNVAVVPLTGFLSQKPTLFSMLFGGTSVQAFAREVVSALADPSVGAVVMDVDSPGGEVHGLPEAAAQIRAARGSKPLVAVANPIAASAAYWLSSQADEFAVTPSALAGSIGVFAAHVDESKALEAAGLGVTLVSYGRRKTEGASTAPLSEDALAAIQARVDAFGRMFEADVAKGRKVSAAKVHADFGEGGIMTADESVKSGLADRVATLDEVIARLAAGYKTLGGSERAHDAAEVRFRARLAGIEVK
jgi:signal peptide peptidase SppA